MKYFADYNICGSDGVLPLDGRFTLANMAAVARAHGQTSYMRGKGVRTFTIERGERFTSSFTVRLPEHINGDLI